MFDPDKVKYSDVIVPPYDVISAADRKSYQKRSPYNMIHIILSETNHNDTYHKTSLTFNEFKKNRVIVQDETPQLYLVEQASSHEERRRMMLIAEVDIRDYGKTIHPHEQTFDGPINDRMALLDGIKANTGIPLVLYDDLHRRVRNVMESYMKSNPYVSFTTADEIIYTIWKISEPETHKQISEIMKDKHLYIADGHHRIGAAYRYSKKNPQCTRMLMALCNCHDENKKVHPTHRLVYGIDEDKLDALEDKLADKYFDIRFFQHSVLDEEMQLDKMKRSQEFQDGRLAIGMYYPKKRRYYALAVKDTRRIVEWVTEAGSGAGCAIRKMLDVSWLHHLILAPYLGLNTTDKIEKHVDFVKGTHEDAIRVMSSDPKYQLIFFLNPVRIRSIIEIAQSNDTVPQKTTYFSPKVHSGIVIQTIHD